MKAIISLSLVLAVSTAAVIASLVIFELITFEAGTDYALKSVSAILVFGAASLLISLITSRNKREGG